MDKTKIEKLKVEQVEDVFEIEKAFFDVTNSSSIEASLSSETLDYFVLKLDEKIIGFLECSCVLDESELYEIAIKKEYQGKGYSKLLMDYFLSFCKDKKIKTIFLEVNTINNKAIALYEKFGFERYSVRKNYYGENDAILMKLDL